MATKNIIVGPSGTGTWTVKSGSRVVSTHRTQKMAISKARPFARANKAEVVIRGRDGKVRDSDSYGKDPRSIKDRKH